MVKSDLLFFDTDCLSAFLWVDDLNLLTALYPQRIIIPAEVYTELSNPTISHLKKRLDRLIENNDVFVESIDVCSEAFDLYQKLISKIGKGEASALVLAKERNGIVASNNLKDIAFYVSKFHLSHKTTGDILKDALIKGLITEAQGNQLWDQMLKKKRKLGADTFTKYLNQLNMSFVH